MSKIKEKSATHSVFMGTLDDPSYNERKIKNFLKELKNSSGELFVKNKSAYDYTIFNEGVQDASVFFGWHAFKKADKLLQRLKL